MFLDFASKPDSVRLLRLRLMSLCASKFVLSGFLFVPLGAILSGCDVSPVTAIESHIESTNNTALALSDLVPTIPDISPAEKYPGGDATVSIVPFPRFDKLVSTLPEANKAAFYAGRALANQPWIKAPASTDARDGLGPVYNARACLACHINGGRGLMPVDNESPLFSALVRISVADVDLDPSLVSDERRQDGVTVEPVYGDQLQTQSVSLAHQLRHVMSSKTRDNDVDPEADVHIHWQTREFRYPDGTHLTLRRPMLDIRNLGYGPLAPNTLTSIRLAPAIHGAGLVELIDPAAIEALVDVNDVNNDGISGRINYVWDPLSKKVRPGRFGYKATRSNLTVVVAAAFANDLGISNPLFPRQPCMPKQKTCLEQADGNDKDGVELSDDLLQLVVDFNRNLGVPVRRNLDAPDSVAGRRLFYQIGCAQCHQPSFVTRENIAQTSDGLSHLGGQTIWPYSDFLLHDMGPELADNRPDFDASGSEWRTAPLWGVGLSEKVNGSRHFLHDGRARSVEEAVLWHGGEAERAKHNFVHLSVDERRQLMLFVESL